MSTLELGFIVFVGLVVLLGSAISLYVMARAYFGGRSTFRPPPAAPRSGTTGP